MVVVLDFDFPVGIFVIDLSDDGFGFIFRHVHGDEAVAKLVEVPLRIPLLYAE